MKQPPLAMLAAVTLLGQLASNPDRDRYSGFIARYREFGSKTIFPLTEDYMRTSGGYDVTSCFYPQRGALLEILQSGVPCAPPGFLKGRIRMFVSVGGDEWFVDDEGGIHHRGRYTKLSKDAFYELKGYLLGVLPVNGPFLLTPAEHKEKVL